jgi:3-dehydroquinate dehydratase-2
LGTREKKIYGNQDFNKYFKNLQLKYKDLDLHYFQSNIEGELINKIQETGFDFDGIIINAAAYTHTSVGIGDAIRSITTPVVEVHISNTYSREEFRHKSFLTPHVVGIILGFGLKSYDLAISSFLN